MKTGNIFWKGGGKVLRYVGMGLVVFGCTALGMEMSSDRKKRIRDIRELQKILDLLEGEIGYAHASLPESFRQVSGRVKPPFSGFLAHMAEHMEAFLGDTLKEIFRQHVRDELEQTALQKDDLEDLIRFGEQLGYLDVKMQLTAIAFYREQLAQSCEQAQELYRNQSKLFRCLGIMGGLFLVIIFL